MTDADIVERIDCLAHAQQEIYLRHSRADRRAEDGERLRTLKDELDRCWGMRRAVRAWRDADRFTDDALILPSETRQLPRATHSRRR